MTILDVDRWVPGMDPGALAADASHTDLRVEVDDTSTPSGSALDSDPAATGPDQPMGGRHGALSEDARKLGAQAPASARGQGGATVVHPASPKLGERMRIGAVRALGTMTTPLLPRDYVETFAPLQTTSTFRSVCEASAARAPGSMPGTERSTSRIVM